LASRKATVVGSGPNGLAAAVRLAQAGLEVTVHEEAATVGGGCRTAELTLPGFRHDVCAAVLPLARRSPAFAGLDVEWIDPPAPAAHALLKAQARFGAGAVLGPNVSLTSSVPIIDVTGSEPVEHRGYVPPRAIVIPGTRPKAFPAGTYHLACALIVGWRSEATELKVSLNEALREHGLG